MGGEGGVRGREKREGEEKGRVSYNYLMYNSYRKPLAARADIVAYGVMFQNLWVIK